MFDTTAKRSLDTAVPLLGGTAALYYTWKKGKSTPAQLLMAFVVVALVLYIVTTQITKRVIDYNQANSRVNVPVDAANTVAPDFEAGPYAQSLKTDIYSLGWRDNDIYTRVAALNNAQLALIYQYWQQHYYSEDGETLVGAMKGESYGNWNSTAHNAKNIMTRLESMGLS